MFDLQNLIKSGVISIGRSLFLRLWLKYELEDMKKTIQDNNVRLREFEEQLRRIEDAVYFKAEVNPISFLFSGEE